MTKRKLSVVPKPDEEPSPGVEDEWESLRAVKKEPVTWLIPDRIPSGSVIVIEGEKGVGKSTFLSALAAAVSRGRPLVGRRKLPRGDVLWCAGEESVGRDVRPRVEAAGGDVDRIHVLRLNERGQRRRIMLPAGASRLSAAIDHYSASLTIIDPLSAHVPSDVSLIADQDIHTVLDPLADVAHATGCTILCSRNLTKNTQATAINRGLGGAAIAGVARAVLRIDWPDRSTARRVLRVVACNSTKGSGPMEYFIVDAKGSGVLAHVRDLGDAADDTDEAEVDPGERDVRADARTLLRRLIGDDWVSVKAIESEAESACIGSRTLRFAKAELGVQSRRVGSASPAYWEWGPPKKGWS